MLVSVPLGTLAILQYLRIGFYRIIVNPRRLVNPQDFQDFTGVTLSFANGSSGGDKEGERGERG